ATLVVAQLCATRAMQQGDHKGRPYIIRASAPYCYRQPPYGRNSDAPVISAGFGRFINSSSVGAISESRPSANDTLPAPTTTSGPGFVVWAVCAPPVSGSRINSQLP